MFVDAISLGTTCSLPFDEAVELCRSGLVAQGFGILHEFDFQDAIVTKTGTDIGSYRVLAACHPESAPTALQEVPSIGVLLPCNVAIYQSDDHVVIKTVNPKPQMDLLDRDEVDAVAHDISERLHRFLSAIAQA